MTSEDYSIEPLKGMLRGGSDSPLIKKLDELSSKRLVRLFVYASSLIFFFALILFPPLIGIIENISHINIAIYEFGLMSRANSAVLQSFLMAFIVSTLDLIAALPLAWFIARSKSRAAHFIDALVDIPFLMPTAALGYSLLLFWSSEHGLPSFFGVNSIVPQGFFLVLLLHFAFSYPVIVRVMVGELLSYREVYEVAARTLGARPWTAVRTITLPLLKPGIIASFLLAFARSLSETGATVMVAGPWENGPVFLFNLMEMSEAEIPSDIKNGMLVYVSSILILASIAVFFLISLLAPKIRFPFKCVFPGLEGKISSPKVVRLRNVSSLAIFLSIVIIPSIFVAFLMIEAIIGKAPVAFLDLGLWGGYWRSMLISYGISSLATLLNLFFGLPVAIIIARRKLGRATPILRAIINIPIIIPSIVLGISLRLFWEKYASIHDFWALLSSHTTITYTYFVASMAAAVEGIPQELEEVASTLGAKPLAVFRRIILPLTKYSVLSGAILVFTRALSETGAAKAVAKSREFWTLPILLVNWLKDKSITDAQRALGAGLYMGTSFIILLTLRFVARRRRE
ncbi:MAG: ABC transporter permease subunit [Candidatus Bathyarchaeia archaeon]